MRARVVCIGNELASDDGIGIRIGRVLGALALPAVTVQIRPQVGLELLDDLEAADDLLIVDAMRTGRPPGTIAVLDSGDPALTTEHALVGHTLGIAAVLAVARKVDPARMPGRVRAVGIEAAVLDRFGTRLSPPVRDALPAAVTQVLELLDQPAEVVAAGRAEAVRQQDWEPGPGDLA
jgi:hydrogenase maturation protease